MVKTETKTKLSLKDCFEKQILIKKEAGKNRTAGNYASALNKFISYAGLSKVQKMSLEDLMDRATDKMLDNMLRKYDNKKKARSSLNKKKSHSPIEMLGMRCKFMFMSIAKMFAII